MDSTKVLEICQNLTKILDASGNINFITKEDLYTIIDYLRINFNIDINEPFNVPKFYKENLGDLIDYELYKFNDHKIGGFLVKNNFPDKSHIIVNSSKELLGTIFDLTHELMHFFLHPENRKHYISTSLCDIDNFEWQANEGAAELLVPYKKFIPLFVKNISKCEIRKDYLDLLQHLSKKFIVSTAVLEYRIIGLKYEINQFENGINIDDLKILSKRAQEENGIFIQPYADKFRQKDSMKAIIGSIDKSFYSSFNI